MLVAQSCPTVCDPVDYSLPGSSVLGIFQARIPEWVAIPFSRGSSQPRDRTQVSCMAGQFFPVWATREVKTRMLGKTEDKRRVHRGWDGWMASPNQWTWSWVNSGRCWRTGKPCVLQSMGLNELDTTEWLNNICIIQASQVVLVVKSSPANAGDVRDRGLTPGLRRSPGEGNGNPLPYPG